MGSIIAAGIGAASAAQQGSKNREAAKEAQLRGGGNGSTIQAAPRSGEITQLLRNFWPEYTGLSSIGQTQREQWTRNVRTNEQAVIRAQNLLNKAYEPNAQGVVNESLVATRQRAVDAAQGRLDEAKQIRETYEESPIKRSYEQTEADRTAAWKGLSDYERANIGGVQDEIQRASTQREDLQGSLLDDILGRKSYLPEIYRSGLSSIMTTQPTQFRKY